MSIKKNAVVLTVFCLSFFPVKSISEEYRHFLWSMEKKIITNDIYINYDDHNNSGQSYLSGGFKGEYNARNLYSNCSGNQNNLNSTQEKTAWLIIRDSIVIGNSLIKLDILNQSGWRYPAQPQDVGYVSKVNQITVNTPVGVCWPNGGVTTVDFHWSDAVIKATVVSGGLAPGIYRAPVMFYYGFEENKFTSESYKGPSANIPNLIKAGYGGIDSFNLVIAVRSKCNFNTNVISLKHDIILGKEETYESNLSTYNISCDSEVPITMELIGANKVSGKNSNYTTCGDGECELKFSNGKYKDETKVIGSKDYIINSTFHINGKVNAGTFQGAGVLRLTIH
ncbi:hypothetical protein C9446_02560 [Providencia heimbachae]|uniref:hypothetical protein n=1 Tax=Providencia heimbachae TaxID=333962 RepID=UPI0010BEDBBC|nr:hypothetical protein C9446_02560 [Providencia heimbachae]